MNSTKSLRAALAAFLLSLAGTAGAQTSYVGALDGTSTSSTFTTAVNGTNSITTFGWTSFSGAAARVFGQTGGTTNDVLIAGDGENFSNYGVQFNTGVSLLPSTTYTLSFLVGYVSAGTTGVNSFKAQIGTWDGASFTPLSSYVAQVSRGSGPLFGASFGADIANSVFASFVYSTDLSVSGDPIMVRWEQTASDIQIVGADFFGVDNVVLSYPTAVPEPSTYAALCGLGALAFVVWRRRSQARHAA